MKNNILLKPFLHKELIEAGCDEAGRGPLAGPVFAASVILPKNFYHPLLNDSKKMTKKNRIILREVIEKEAISYSVVNISVEKIDKINILNASILGMQNAVLQLNPMPEFLLIDGNKFKEFNNIPYQAIIHGDAIYSSIAAASVLAKTYRDEFMENLSKKYPEYGWDKNMGYPTKSHIKAIKEYGLSPWHRKSFHVKELEPILFNI